MELEEWRKAINQVSVESVKIVFTTQCTKIGDPSRGVIQQSKQTEPNLVKFFIWPKVTVKGPGGTKTHTFTWWRMGAKQAKNKAQQTRIFVKAIVMAAFGKIVPLKGVAKIVAVEEAAKKLERTVDARIGSAARGKMLTKKVDKERRALRREAACKVLFKTMESVAQDLTDYDVKETWRLIKRNAVVRSVMES
jgi:hypothetical protein